MLGIDETKLVGLKCEGRQKDGHLNIELFLSCRNLKNRDLISKSDPQIRVYTVLGGKRVQIGETEIIKDNLNPNFSTPIRVNYIFEVKQKLYFEILDIDSETTADPLGEVKAFVGEIMGAKNQSKIYDINLKGKNSGKLIVRGEPIEGPSRNITMEFQAKNLRSMVGCFGTTKPVLELSRTMGNESSSTIKVFESKIEDGLHPIWESFTLNFKTLANNDKHTPITATVSHVVKRNNTRYLIGSASFTIEELEDDKKKWELKNQKFGEKVAGYLCLTHFSVKPEPSFLDYLRCGIQLNVMVAVDFTGSNGNPKDSKSLHFMNPKEGMNQYQKAIYGVLDILLDYDYDKQIPMYGFGAKLPGKKEVNDCFSMTKDEKNPYVNGLDGVMQAYKDIMKKITLSGPTKFSPVISKSLNIASKEKLNGNKVYTILLIITDGILNDDDMKKTIDLLVEGADLPLSVIIIGVGDANFNAMDRLDGDGAKLRNSKGIQTKRDIVQFVPFNKFNRSKEKLAEEVLAEVPSQFLSYMKTQNVELSQVSIMINQ